MLGDLLCPDCVVRQGVFEVLGLADCVGSSRFAVGLGCMDFDVSSRRSGKVADAASVDACVVMYAVSSLELFDNFRVNMASGLPGVWEGALPANFVFPGCRRSFEVNDAIKETFVAPFAFAHVNQKSTPGKERKVAV